MLERVSALLVVASVLCVPVTAAEPDTAEVKIAVLTELSRKNRENRQKLRTWEGTLAYRIAFRLSQPDFNRMADGKSKMTFVPYASGDEWIEQRRTGRVAFRRVVEPDLLAEEIKDDGPITFVGTTTETPYSQLRSVREERVLALPDELMSFKPNLAYAAKDDKQRSLSVEAVRHSSRKRDRYNPVWPLDTNPWTGEFIDPLSFFGHDRPTEDYLDLYIASLRGDHGAEYAAQVNRAVKLTSRVVDDETLLTLEGDLTGRVERLEFREKSGQLVAQCRWIKEQNKPQWIDYELTWEYETSEDLWTPKIIAYRQHKPRGAGVSKRIEYKILSSKVNSPLPEDSFTESFLRAPGDAWLATSAEKGIRVSKPMPEDE